MAKDELFGRLKRSSSSRGGSQEYTFQNGGGKKDRSRSFSTRESRQSSTTTQGSRPSKRDSAPTVFERDDNGDRPSAVSRRREGVVYEHEDDTWRDVWFELGLRVFESALAAGALAVGEEVFYYFSQRRLRHRRRAE